MKANFPRSIVRMAAMFFVIFTPSARGDALDNWNASQLVTNPVGLGNGFSLTKSVYGNGRFVAVGSAVAADGGIVEVSNDGMNWIRTSNTFQTFITGLHDVAFGNGKFVAVGWGGLGNPSLYSSTNGIDWPNRTNGLIANFYGVAYGAGKFVATGDGNLWEISGSTSQNIYTSLNGINWTARDSGSVNTITDVAYGAGQFVAVDFEGYIYTSTLGTIWSSTFNGYPKGRIVFCKDFFFVPVGRGTNLVSTNGVAWVLQTNNTAQTFKDVVYGNGFYMAISDSNLFTSVDGANWSQRNLIAPTNVIFQTIAIGENNAVVFGNNWPQTPVVPSAVVSDPFVRLNINFNFPPQLDVSGLQGRPYRIDFLNSVTSVWQTLTSFSLTNSPLSWTDSTATNSQRFYRAVLLP